MTAAQAVGAVMVLAELALMAYVLGPLLWRYRAVCREWAALTAQVEAARADFEPVLEAAADAAASVVTDELVADIYAYLEDAR